MFIKKEFDDAIHHNNTKIIKLFLSNKKIPEDFFSGDFIRFSAANNDVDMVEILIKDGRFIPNIHKNFPLTIAAGYGYIDIVKLLLNDPRVDPVGNKNSIILDAYSSKHNEVVDLLWADKRVKDSLKNDVPELYYFLVNNDIKNKVIEF